MNFGNLCGFFGLVVLIVEWGVGGVRGWLILLFMDLDLELILEIDGDVVCFLRGWIVCLKVGVELKKGEVLLMFGRLNLLIINLFFFIYVSEYS